MTEGSSVGTGGFWLFLAKFSPAFQIRCAKALEALKKVEADAEEVKQVAVNGETAGDVPAFSWMADHPALGIKNLAIEASEP